MCCEVNLGRAVWEGADGGPQGEGGERKDTVRLWKNTRNEGSLLSESKRLTRGHQGREKQAGSFFDRSGR